MAPDIEPRILPEVALNRLKEGNERFVQEKRTHFHTDAEQRKRIASDGQTPFATILACSDSRVPVEIIFDQGIGDLFVVRVAGNICNRDQMGSIEYGVENFGTPLLVVMGHTDCKLVTSIALGEQLRGNLSPVVSNIHLAVSSVKRKDPGISGEELIRASIEANVWQSFGDLFRGSYAMDKLAKSGGVKVVGAVYDVHGGRVNWLGEHPER